MTQKPPLRLQARDAEDLAVISAVMQDAVVSVAEMGFVATESRFAMVVNRFMWESDCDQRVLCGVRFEGVQRVQFRDIDVQKPDLALEILAIQPGDENQIMIYFAGGGCLRLEASALLCLVEDRAVPRPACGRPAHDLAQERETSHG